MDQPPGAAVRTVRHALSEAGLRTPAELDITESLKTQLHASLAPAVVLYVDAPLLLMEAVMFYPAAALYMPQPIVIAAKGRGSQVQVICRESAIERHVPPSVRAAILRLHRMLLRALSSVAVLETETTAMYAHSLR